jgi:hypothetical protein
VPDPDCPVKQGVAIRDADHATLARWYELALFGDAGQLRDARAGETTHTSSAPAADWRQAALGGPEADASSAVECLSLITVQHPFLEMFSAPSWDPEIYP